MQFSLVVTGILGWQVDPIYNHTELSPFLVGNTGLEAPRWGDSEPDDDNATPLALTMFQQQVDLTATSGFMFQCMAL